MPCARMAMVSWCLLRVLKVTTEAHDKAEMPESGIALAELAAAAQDLVGDLMKEDEKMAKEWHGTFASTRKSPRAEFVALLRVGADCTRASGATATRVDGGWQVAVDGKTITFAGDNVSLR